MNKQQRLDKLRQKAEEQLKQVMDSLDDKSSKDVQTLLHDLHVHQIELTLQNEELLRTQAELEASRKKYADLYDFAPVGYCTLEKDGTIREINFTAADQLGAERDLLHKKRIQDYVVEDDQATIFLHLRKAFDTHAHQTCELRLLKRDGTSFYAHLESSVVQEGKTHPCPSQEGIKDVEASTTSHCRTTITDITEQKRVEEALRESKERFRSIFSQSPIGIELYDKEGSLIDANPSCLNMFGVKELDVVKGFKLFKDPNLPKDAKKRLLKNESVRYETRFDFEIVKEKNLYATTRSGQCFIECFITPWGSGSGDLKGFLVHVTDITARKQAENQLQAALQEKEILMREILHRTKNNMTAIVSLLRFQSDRIEDDQMVRMFEDIENRIQSMLLVQQKLYQSKDFTSLDFKEYVMDLAYTIFSNLRVGIGAVSLRFDLESVTVSPDIAIPCGLLLNELLTNALKYAFPGNKTGEIRIILHTTDEGEIEFGVRDTGIGMPEDFDVEHTDSLGLQLVMSFVNQLLGSIELKREQGTEWLIRFKK